MSYADGPTLWGVYAPRDNDTHDGWHAAQDRTSAAAMAAKLKDLHPVVATWPFGAEEHMADLARAEAGR